MKSIPPQGADAPAVAPRLLLVALFAITLVAAAAWYLLQTDDGATEAGVDERLTPLARELATAIETAVSPYREAAAALSTDTDVRAALAALERGSLAALAAAKRPALPELLALRLLPAATRDPEMDTHPPLSFASISLLRRAREEARDPPLEAHLIGTADEHLVLLTRVEEPAGNLVGFVHLSLDPDLVRAPLRTAAPASAYAELRQGAKVRLAASGRAPPVEAPVTSVPVRGTTFVVALKAEGRAPAAQRPGVPPLVWLVALLVALLLGGVVVWQRRPAVRVGEPLDDGSVIYQGAIKAILDGVYPGLEQLLPRAQTGGGNVALADLVELDRAEGEDVTTFNVPGAVPPPEQAPPLTTAQPAATDEDDSAEFFFVDEEPAEQAAANATVPAAVFRGYDIRGIVGETLTEEGIYLIGRAIGAEAEARGQRTVVVARDGRHSSVSLQQALTKGLLESGREVLDIGLVPTPVLYFATHFLDARSGVMVTGSHNPAAYNGLKIVLDGETLCGEAIQAIRNRVDTQDFVEGTGSLQATDIIAEYIRRISEEIPVTLGHALKVVVDCGNAVPGIVAPDILRAIGHDVIELYCDIDGDFPHHHPDPSTPDNLARLIETVLEEGADLGLAFDGDGDRLGVVDGSGRVIWPDRQLMLFARDVLARHPGAKILFDVKCSRHLAADITAHGGEAVMAPSGHALIKQRMQETGALLAGELSGHIFFKDRWYGFDDAIYSAARLLEIIVNGGGEPARLFDALPGGVATPELRVDMPEAGHAAFMQAVLATADFADGEVSTLDGLRVDLPDAFGLIRPSNTMPCLVFRFEGDDEAALAAIQARFRELVQRVAPGLELPF